MRFESFLNQTLDELAAAKLLREPDDGEARRSVDAAAAAAGFPAIDASSNDYLGLGTRSVSRETYDGVRPGPSTGAGASRLIHGTTDQHLRLEADLAAWVGCESSLLFSSTYAANVGLMSALGARDTVIISDSANHASIIDGARLGRANVRVVPHLNLDAMQSALNEARRARSCWVVTESYFSMDGDGPDLGALRELCDESDACLIVDEAHSLGIFGEGGSGRCAAANIRPDILVGALGKAVGSHGGFVAGSRTLRTFLWNKARSFVFSTAPSPYQTELTRDQLRVVRAGADLRQKLASSSAQLRAALAEAAAPVAPGSFGPIVSLILGGNERAHEVAQRLRASGVLAQAILPPTVPAGAARLRLTVKATFSPADVDRLARLVEEACRES